MQKVRNDTTHIAFATGYRTDIDGLRALAVLAVIFFHAKLWPFGGGFVGVDVFFVISGYLITSIIKRELDNHKFTLAGFYERRIRRIFPALFFVLLVVTPLAIAVLLPVETMRYGQTLVATALFAANIYFWRIAGYFAPDSERNPLLHTWSLAVEEQFYILYPIALLLLLRYASRRVLLLLLGVGIVGSLALAEWQMAAQPGGVFYLLPTRAWELLLGAVLALAALPNPGVRLQAAAGGVGLALIGASILLYSPTMTFPGLSAVPPCLGTALLLYAGQRPGGAVSSALSYGPVRFIGQISYSLYLWHLPLLVLARIHLDRALLFVESATLIALSGLLAAFSWKFIETPFRRNKPRTSWRVIGAGVTGLLVFCAAGWLLITTDGIAGRFPRNVVVADAAQIDEIYPPSCVGPNATNADRCRDASFDILVWGDSHAAHIFAGIERRAAEASLTAQLQWVGGCPPVMGAVPVALPPEDYAAVLVEPQRQRNCARLNRDILAVIEEHPSVKAVALAGAWSFWTEGRDIGTNERRYLSAEGSEEFNVEESRRVLREGLERTVVELRDRGIEVLLLGQVPDHVKSPSHCMALAYAEAAGLTECAGLSADAFDRSAEGRRVLADIAAAHGAHFFDPTASLCKGERCVIESGSMPLYRDADHLTTFGAEIVVSGAPPDFFRAASRAPAARSNVGAVTGAR